MSDKTKKSIAGAILAASIIGGVITGGGFEKLDVGNKSHWFTKTQYKNLKAEFKNDYIDGKFSNLDLFWGASEKFKIYRAIINKEAKKEKFKEINETNMASKIIDILITE